MTFLATVFVFGLLIVFHEFGHFIVAKMSGVRVLEFSVGMGPKIFGYQRGPTLYALRALPIGGYVRMAGMDPEENKESQGRTEHADSDESVDFKENKEVRGNTYDSGSFSNKSISKRAAIIFAGSFMNFVLAFLLFIYIYAIVGTPMFTNIIGDVIPERPAAMAGIEPGDRVVAVDDRPVSNWAELIQEIHPRAGEELRLLIDRQGSVQEFRVTPMLDPERNVGQLGIVVDEGTIYHEKQSLLTSIRLGLMNTYMLTSLILESLFQMITGAAPADVGGPVMIVSEIGKAAETGWSNLLMLAAILSVNLGIINLLPIPALDGSRLIFLGIEAVRGKPIDPAKENMIHLIGFAFLIALMILIAYRDVIRLMGGG
ncbi:RIP metalloprotease RseP [Heliorestis convoluta]|uniref:Zinc metalloprotease n=1 Tax=Heliorestis convoluta TaxID=356322 RepID=A0A5Q2N2V8_9FIRM|nr:RIP metalloprotease RseP [Heliorestis convoluta]QGG48209.1 RIP metalloprotease RseP [Heliorestis convoluta]